MARDFLYCEETDTKIYSGDIVTISSFPDVKFIAKQGWHKVGTAQVHGWYFVNILDKTTVSIDQVDIRTVSKVVEQGTSELRPTVKDIDTKPSEPNYLVIPGTNIRLYDGDIVKISGKPRIKWVVHTGWYLYDGNQNFGWYFVSIKNGDILPAATIDLTRCTLDTVKTQGSGVADGKVVNYTRPFTLADAELLNRTFITVDTIEQRDNLDQNKLINGRMIRVNDVGGAPAYYVWNAADKVWEKSEDKDQGIPEVIGTTENPIILSELEPGLYRVIGTYKISPTYEMITLTGIHHLVFVSEDDEPNIKVITDSDITDYKVSGEDVIFVNAYATQKYVADHYVTKEYVDNKIAVIEAQISEIISEFDDKVLAIVNERLDEALNEVPEAFINSLFD